MRRAAVSYVRLADGRILCVWNRRYMTWSFPGGLVEEGESPAEAQARELREETGLQTLSARMVHEDPHGGPSIPGRASVVCVFVVDLYVGIARESEEGCPVSWMTSTEFLDQSLFRDFYARLFDEGVLP